MVATMGILSAVLSVDRKGHALDDGKAVKGREMSIWRVALGKAREIYGLLRV